MANAAKKINFVIQSKRDGEKVLRDRGERRWRSEQRTVARNTLAICRWVRVQFRIQTRCSNTRECPRLREPRNSCLQTLVVGHRPLFVLVELFVVEDLPPRALRNLVGGVGRLPRSGRLPAVRNGDFRLLVFRPSSESAGSRKQEHAGKCEPLHDCPPAGVPTCTCSPSSRESGGFSTRVSVACKPPRISTSDP